MAPTAAFACSDPPAEPERARGFENRIPVRRVQLSQRRRGGGAIAPPPPGELADDAGYFVNLTLYNSTLQKSGLTVGMIGRMKVVTPSCPSSEV